MRARESFTVKEALSVVAGVFVLGGIVMAIATCWNLASMIPMFTAEIMAKCFIVSLSIAAVCELFEKWL